MAFLYPNGMMVDPNSIIHKTSTSLLLYHAEVTLKIPLLDNLSVYDESSSDLQTAHTDNETNTGLLEREKAIYLRLDEVEGVARCLPGSPGGGILLDYYPNGTLERRIIDTEPIEGKAKRRWVTEIISVLIRIHRAGVLARADISLANFVFGNDGEGSITMVGFAHSAMAFPGVDVAITVDASGRSGVKQDIFHLGCVIYSIAGQGGADNPGIDTAAHALAIERLPVEEISVFGEMILRCWGGGFESMQEVGSAWLEIYSDLAGQAKTQGQGYKAPGNGSTATQGVQPADEDAYDNID